MTIKTVLTALVLISAPALASAQCMWGEHSTQEAAISCAEGTIWDATAMACVATASS
ncbi:adenylosuccinate lyase [Hasllibacter sp. MH4015]|uniref:adenylosuccinate lyase n=1 Tax=Hasllibacter sp. MH4015 TaxID=2854029 RepID=UPI001CD4EE38|nr:adenylosuccinate lyase [Hasllibacter sp. MH4015]